MNFQINLWNNYELINDHFNTNRKVFKDFLNMMNEKYKYDNEYAKGMKKIYDSNYVITSEGTLGDGIKNSRDYFFGLFNHYSEMALNIKNEILEPSKKFLDEQNSIGKKLYSDIKKWDKDYKDALLNLEKSKFKFLNAAKNAEVACLDSELAKISYIPQTEKEKFYLKEKQLLKDAKEAEKLYLVSIKTANAMRVIYIEGSKSVLFNYQLLEEELIEFAKNITRKHMLYSNATYKNSLCETEKLTETIEKINVDQDINTFIEKNTTNSLPPGIIEYMPYSIMLRAKPIEETTYPLEVIYNVVLTLQSTFEKTDGDFNPVEERKKIELLEMSRMACLGEHITEKRKKVFYELLSDKDYRNDFFSYLNKYRASGRFTITINAFLTIGDIFNYILREVIVNKDYHSAKYCIILSQTYHFIDESNQQKVFLQTAIEKNELFQIREFWENFIAYSIYKEIDKNTSNTCYIESEEDKNIQIINIVFSQLVPITDNMLGFEIDKDVIKEIILSFSKQYNILNDMNQHLIQMVDGYVYKTPVGLCMEPNEIEDSNHRNSLDKIKEQLSQKYVNVINQDKHSDLAEKIIDEYYVHNKIDKFEHINYFDL